MVAVCFIDTGRKGLAAYGAETLCFQMFPSCFSLNVNSLHILNMSSDYLCSARCGFPFPRQMVIDLDTDGMLDWSDYAITSKPKWPIAARPIIRPVVQIYQPILHGSGEELSKCQADPWVKANLIAGSERQGLLSVSGTRALK